MSDPLEGFKHTATEHGWRFGWHPSYPDIVTIACACGHLSVRDRDDVPEHVCPSCEHQARLERSDEITQRVEVPGPGAKRG